MITRSGKRNIVQMVFVTVSRWQVDLDLIYFKVNFCSLYGILEGKIIASIHYKVSGKSEEPCS